LTLKEAAVKLPLLLYCGDRPDLAQNVKCN
jgi:hypothetical protein